LLIRLRTAAGFKYSRGMNTDVKCTVAAWGSPADVFRHLQGDWLLDRRVDGLALMQGFASFGVNGDRSPDPGSLAYREHGRARLAEGQEFEAERKYLYRAGPVGFSVFFAEVPPRLFHDVTLEASGGDLVGQACHLCGEDRYLSRYEFLADGTFFIRHDVLGPRKNYVLETSYRRNQGKRFA